MKPLQEIQDIIQQHKLDLAEKYGVAEIGIFGSIVRGEARDNSDVDVLVEFDRPIGLLKFVNMERYLEGLIDAKVDLVMKKALKPRIGKHILEEVIML